MAGRARAPWSAYSVWSPRWGRRGEHTPATGPTDIYVHDASYPDGWVVEASDTAGTWTHTFDEGGRMLSVTTPDTGGTHTICVRPAGSAPGCAGTPAAPADPTDPGVGAPDGPDAGVLPPAPPAVPVPGRSTYTG